MFQSRTFQGIALGMIAAVCYGLIPTFTLPISGETGGAHALSDLSVMFYRFIFAALVLGGVMLFKRCSFRITREELATLIYLAFLSDGAALFLIAGYPYRSSGVATTIHFLYPVMITLIMVTFYHEARKLSTFLAVGLAVVGVGVLSYQPGQGINVHGVLLELISAFCYAFYLIRVNRSRVQHMDGLKLTFYVMAIGGCIFGAEAFRQDCLQPLTTQVQWANIFALVMICTVVTNLSLVLSVKRIGSTMTAVLGALEPLTAVALGCFFFNEAFTWNVGVGIGMILPAVLIIIYTRTRKATEKPLPPTHSQAENVD